MVPRVLKSGGGLPAATHDSNAFEILDCHHILPTELAREATAADEDAHGPTGDHDVVPGPRVVVLAQLLVCLDLVNHSVETSQEGCEDL